MKLLDYVDLSAAAAADDDEFVGAWREDEKKKARGYLPSDGLIDAANVARILGQPLLLTGEPGTGKTQFAYYVSWKLGLDAPLIFETKSTSTARDLFYTYDTLGRFHAAHTENGGAQTPEEVAARARKYITYNALGIAILRANGKESVREWVPEDSGIFDAGERRPSVVLVDEIDKAPRDFPNDLLNEVENMYFRVPELSVTGSRRIEAPEGMRPVLILTSNSEKHLPDAFLRRCVYYNIPFPTDEVLRSIVLSRLGGVRGMDSWLGEALAIFAEVRKLDARLNKTPATAELLGWLKAMHQMFELKGIRRVGSLREHRGIVQSTLGATLLKSYSDQKLVESLFDKWLGTG